MSLCSKKKRTIGKNAIKNSIGWQQKNKSLLATIADFSSGDCHVSNGCRALRKRHCAAAAATSLSHALMPPVHMLNEISDSKVALIANFVTVVTIVESSSRTIFL